MPGMFLKKISRYKTEIEMFLLFFLAYSYFITGFHSANEGSALALTQSIVNEQSLAIDSYKDLASVDISSYNGHYYSDKDIGRALFGIPVYLADKVLGFGSQSQVYFSMELMTAFFSAAGVVLLYRLALFLKSSAGLSLLLSLVYGFGTIIFAYSKTFFAHPYSAFFNLLALFALLLALEKDKKDKSKSKKYLILSGMSAGSSLLMEYTNVFVLGLIFLYGLYRLRSAKIIYFIIPLAVLSSLVPLYNYSIFGNPLTTTYNHQLSYGNIESIYLRPDYLKEGMSGLLVSSWRGLFYYSPILLLSIPGFFIWIKKGKDRLLPILLGLSFIAVFLFYSATPAWRGGNSYGPRYLVAVMPFFVLPMAKTFEAFFAFKKKGVLSVLFVIAFAALFAYSVIFSAMGSFTGPSPAESFTNPFWQQNLPTFMSGFLDSYLYGQGKSSIYLLAFAEFILLWLLLRDFLPHKIKSRIKT